MSGGDPRKANWQEIRRVQNDLIKPCMQRYMTKEETVSALASNEQIEPSLAELAWEMLESKNQDLFRIYYQKLMEKRQIPRNNEAESSMHSQPRSHSPPPTAPESMQNCSTTTTLGSSSSIVQRSYSRTYKFMPTPRFPKVESIKTSAAMDVQVQQSVQLRPVTSTSPSTSTIVDMTMSSSTSESSEDNSPPRNTIFPQLTTANYSDSVDMSGWFTDDSFLETNINIPEWLLYSFDEEDQKDDRLGKDGSSSKGFSKNG